MVDITIAKPTYNWGAPHCIHILTLKNPSLSERGKWPVFIPALSRYHRIATNGVELSHLRRHRGWGNHGKIMENPPESAMKVGFHGKISCKWWDFNCYMFDLGVNRYGILTCLTFCCSC